MFVARAREKGLTLNVDTTDDVPAQVIGDELRVRQILSNFVGNAVKFTEQGGITIRVRVDGAPAKESEQAIRQRFNIPPTCDAVSIRLTVSDTGIGIPADKQEVIFESFIQVDGSATRRYGSSGLSLAINRHLAELMRGNVGVESEVGKGSTFWVTLPFFVPDVEQSSGGAGDILPQQEQSDRDPAHAAARSRGQVLLAEDNEVNRKVAIRFLQKLGYEVDVAEDGVEAVEKTAYYHYDAVLMDLHMPRMDGLEATQRILERERSTGKHQRIIAMTASATKEDVERCLAAGMDDYLSKPVKMEALQAMLEKYENASSAKPTSQSPIDSDFLMEMTGGDPAFTQEVLEEFLKTVPPLMREIEQAVMDGDSSHLALAAHTIKGSARAVGAQRFSDIAYQLEMAGKSQNLQDAPEWVGALREEWQRLQDSIHQQFLQQAA